MRKRVTTFYQVWQGDKFKVYKQLHPALRAVSNSEHNDVLLRKFMEGVRWSSAEPLLRMVNREIILYTEKGGRHIINNFHLNRFNIPKI